jgi:hypothetical protein
MPRATSMRSDAPGTDAALHEGCSAFLTNDRRLPVIAGLRILQLRDYLPG